MDKPPIFLIPLKRTGGTLFVTMLGCHSELTLSYEIYEQHLRPEQKNSDSALEMKKILEDSYNTDPLRWLKGIKSKSLRSFAACARRGGLEVIDVLKSLNLFISQGGNFNNIDGRLSYIELLMRSASNKFNTEYWGGKAKVDSKTLQSRHPNAIFFFMLRDGRDVLASQLNSGKFNVDVLASAKEWRNYLLEYKALKYKTSKVMLVKYEELVYFPEKTLRKAFKLIGVSFEETILNYHNLDLTLFKNPHGHLSYKSIGKGLHDISIGRYKNDLTDEQIQEYENINMDLLAEYGYLDMN